MNRSDRYRSIFWPVLLIGLGLVWLLVNLGLLPGWNWFGLWRLWPLFLIAIGLDLLIARRSAWIGALVALATLALVLLVVLAGGLLGYSSSRVEVVTERFSEAIGSAESAEIELDLSVGPTQIYALDDGELLFDAEVTHIGVMEFSASGRQSKSIQLIQRELDFSFGLLDLVDRDEMAWDVGITPLIPVRLEIGGGVGDAELLLEDLLLEDLVLDVGVGDLKLELPAGEEEYSVQLDGGVGQTQIGIEPGASVTLSIDGSVGDVRIDVPPDAEVRVEADTGVGDVQLPDSFRRVSGSDESFVGDSGVWETAGYSGAVVRITIVLDGGIGDFTVQ